ncbi:ribonuclease P protein component [Pseudactinotalea sp. Z1732]|uniref:ribonuclease P protein component n=2 Tax=unclassified Pseudactinotalea TaxID=2649176 RepID=UPI003C79D031
MLPASHRMRRSAEFADTIGGGGRSAGRYLVVHALLDDDPTPAGPARVGFVVSKAVGGAVQRNRVRRRLRAIMAEILRDVPAGAGLVMRARPPAASATFGQLRADANAQVSRAVRRGSRTVAA